MLPIANKTSACVIEAMKQLQETYNEHFSEVFKTITTDNGSEFADLSELEKMAETCVYYAHPYSSCDKGTIDILCPSISYGSYTPLVFATTFLVEYGCVLLQVHLTFELFSPSLHPHYRNFITTIAS